LKDAAAALSREIAQPPQFQKFLFAFSKALKFRRSAAQIPRELTGRAEPQGSQQKPRGRGT
jgi:hypothetical protein